MFEKIKTKVKQGAKAEVVADVKSHLQNHKEAYVCGVVTVVSAGITALIMRERSAEIRGVSAPEIRGVSGESGKILTRSFNFLSKNSGNVVNTVHTGDRGHPGFLTRHIESNTIFESQDSAARCFDISPSMLSGHLNGKFDNIDGNHFERVIAA